MTSKPTNYEAAKSMVSIGEEVTSAHVIDRLIGTGRREVPSRRQLSALMKKDPRLRGHPPQRFQGSHRLPEAFLIGRPDRPHHGR